ncbi:hypothetical protein STCU_06501 [Strigomonas culicis]|nr:hypothetical protein STCU_06501 [Strigomonas culicis]|eukprot:EPY25742.1 hypothetical protein STCU_06501 [Strigomonas culicis]
MAAQDVHASVEITHMVYTPPQSMEELRAYLTTRGRPAPVEGESHVLSVTAQVRTLGMSNKLESYVVAAFPLETRRVVEIEKEKQKLVTRKGVPEPGDAAAVPPVLALGEHSFVVTPAASDIVACVRIRLDVDASAQLSVVGPGTVMFYGEQHSALIPEWENHRIFRVNEDDEEVDGEEDEEEESEMDDDELRDMFRYSRR